MPGSWADKFKKKLQGKELASQENSKNAKIYQEYVLRLFDWVEKKVKEAEVISVSRKVETSGITPLKSLVLKCQERQVSFLPEGINVDSSRGRIRIRHNCKNISQFIYLHLISDANSGAPYPENLIWIINLNGLENVDCKDMPRFEEQQLENLIETCFLE
jgi:hypothetical protein